ARRASDGEGLGDGAAGAGGATVATGSGAAAPWARPQSGQKRQSGSSCAPQFAQAGSADAPQAWQNFLPGRSSVPQRVQRTADRPSSRTTTPSSRSARYDDARHEAGYLERELDPAAARAAARAAGPARAGRGLPAGDEGPRPRLSVGGAER